MSYLKQVLQPGETVLAESKPHWKVYLNFFFMVALALALAVAACFASSELQVPVLIAAGIIAAIGLLSGAGAAIHRATTELAVTDHRVIYKTGIFSRHTVEMNRTKIESVDVEQSIGGRIFGYGTIILRGTGGTLEPIRGIANPLGFRSAITAG